MTVPSRSTFIRLTVAVLLTAAIIWRAHPSQVAEAFGRVSSGTGWIAIAIALVAIDRALTAWRWLALLRGVDSVRGVSTAAILRVFFVSTFVGTFLGPISAGGDALRAYGLARENVRATDSIASILMDRLLGVLSLLAVTAAGLLLARDLLHDTRVRIALAAAAAGCVVGVVAIYSESAARFFSAAAARVPSAKMARLGSGLVDAVRAYSKRHLALASVLAASIAVQVLRVMQAYALGRALGLGADWTAYAAFVPLILLVMLLPITFFGLGTSQLAFELFTRVGVPLADTVALSFLFLGLGILGNLPGALLYIAGKPERDRSAAS